MNAQRHFGVVVHEGNFAKPKKYCAEHDRYCPFREEKQIDVGMAIKIVRDALSGDVDRIILLPQTAINCPPPSS